MSRLMIAAVAAAALGSACKVERTPAEYFDHGAWSAADVSPAAEELQDRVLATGQAISRRSVTEAMIAVAPGPDARVIAPDAGGVLAGAGEIQAALERFTASDLSVRLSTVTVTVNPDGDAAWFEARAVVQPGDGGAGTPVVVTGIYVMSGGAWELVQAHLSTSADPPSPQPLRD